MEMEKWKAILTNGEIVDEHDMASWRKLKAKCEKENLKIISLKLEGEEVDPRAVSYFIVFDSLTFILSKQQRFRRGLGSFRENGKARIKWVTTQGTIEGGNYTEIVKEVNAVWNDIAIEVDRSQNESQTT